MIRSYIRYENSKGHALRALREKPSNKTQETCVVLCHGRSVDKDELGTFVSLADDLIAAGYDVFRFDYRGCGMSDLADYEYSIQTMEEDLQTTVDYLYSHLGYKKFIIVAASFSGTVAIPFVAKTNYKIERLILRNAIVDTSYKANPSTEFLKQRVEKRRQEIAEKGYSESSPRKFRIGKDCFEQQFEIRPQDYLDQILCPIDMIHGTNDQHVPYELSKSYADKYDHITMHTIENASHGFHSDGQDILGQAVRACVDSI